MEQNNSFNIRPGFKWGVLALQFFLFIISISTAVHFDLSHLNTTGIISVSLDWLSMVILAVIFRSCCNGRLLVNSKEFICLLSSLYLCVFFEVGTWTFDQLAGFRIENYICNIGANCTILLGAFIYFLFIRKSDDIDESVFPQLKNILCVTLIAGIVAELLNFFAGYFYVVDEAGIYIRSPYGSFLGFIPFLVILLGNIIFIHRQKINMQRKIMYMSYYIVPFVCGIWYTFTDYPPTFFVASTIGIMLIHGDIYIAQSKESELFELKNAKTEAEYELARNKLMLSQIRPHFMYNSLGSIEVLCRMDAEKAEHAIHHFTEYLRYNMDTMSSNDTVPFSRELDLIRNYVWLEQMRFDDDLAYKEEIGTVNFRVPQLSIQPLVENAIKHGMMGTADGVLHVVLKTSETENEYVIKVIDDGCGFNPAKLTDDGRSHLGLYNTSYSLKLRMNGTMDIESQPGVGTAITIRIPKQKEVN